MTATPWRMRSLQSSLALPILSVMLFGAGCSSTALDDAARLDAARQAALGTATAAAAPTVAAQQAADAASTRTSVQVTAQVGATVIAAAQATQQVKDVDVRVQAAIAATQGAIPTATPIPPTPVVIVVTQQPAPAPAPVYVQVPAPIYVPAPAPVYVPVPITAQLGSVPQYVKDAINQSNNASGTARWSLNPNDLIGHVTGLELSKGQEKVRGLIQNHTRVASTFVSGTITSWALSSPTHGTATTDEAWHFVNYDADDYTVKRDNGVRLYRNIYTLDYTASLGWKVSLDDVPNANGESM